MEIHSRDSIGIKKVAPDLIDFLGKIQYRDDKRQYFSRSERKVTTSEKARHDKRFIEVPSWANGSFRNIVSLYLLESNHDTSHMRWYSTVHSIAHHMNALYNLNLADEERGFNCEAIFPGDHQEAFRALSFAFDFVEARENTSRVIECALSNIKHQKERESRRRRMTTNPRKSKANPHPLARRQTLRLLCATARWLVWHNSEIAACFSGWLPTTYQPSNVKR